MSAISAQQEPQFRDQQEQLVFDVATITLLATGRVPEPPYRRGVHMLGERGMVELVGILGYYALVAMSLNFFAIDLPQAFAPELGKEPGGQMEEQRDVATEPTLP